MEIQPTLIIGALYAIAVTFLSGYLILNGRMTKKVYIPLLALTALVGFVLSGPFIPLKSVGLLSSPVGQQTIVMGAIVLLLLGSSLLWGRSFCAYACPIGTVQELAYRAPLPKRMLPKRMSMAVRWVVTAAVIVTTLVLSRNVMSYWGVEEFFSLSVTVGASVFVLVFVISLIVYRPFCRLVCPFGAFSSLFASRSRYRMIRTEDCNDCGLCIKACPTQEVDDDGSECYLCMRCVESCHRDSMRMGRR